MDFLYTIHSHPVSPTTLSVPMRHYAFISLPPSSRNAPPCSQNLTTFHAATELEITWFGANKATSGKKHSRELAAAPKGSCCGAIGMTIWAKKVTDHQQAPVGPLWTRYSWLRSPRCEEMGEGGGSCDSKSMQRRAVYMPLV